MNPQHFRSIGCALLVLLATTAAGAQDDTRKVYDDFNAFCLKRYGAEKEPLIYDHFGKDLKVLEGGTWRHVSENSACVAWETNLPATSFVEYGETARYGKKTALTERPFYLHIHTIQGLEPGKTYHYRLVAVDERGNRIETQDAVLNPAKIAGAKRVPDDLAGPPFVIDRAGVYILTKDIVADGTAIQIDASEVTIDLNGHTLTYNNKTVTLDDPKNYEEFKRKMSGGIVTKFGAKGLKICNGTIAQGAGANGAWGSGRGFAPILFDGNSGEIAGVTCVYSGKQVSGFDLRNSGAFDLHHNVFESRSTDVGNRHLGSSAITMIVDRAHHNLVKRVCHKGLWVGSGTQEKPVEVYNNEVYVDSYGTNAYAISCYKNRFARIRDNRVFVTGYHGIGIPTLSCTDVEVSGNLLHLVGLKPLDRFKEYGEMAKIHGFRIKYDPVGGNLDFHHNLAIAQGADGGCVKCATVKGGAQLKNVVFHDNVFKMTYDGDIDLDEKRSSIAAAAQWSAAIAYVGDAPGAIVFRNNVIASNYRNIEFDDGYYASGSNGTFINNRLVKLGDRGDYITLHCGWWDKPHNGNMLIDTKLEGGASLDNVRFVGTGENDFSVAWTLTVKTAPGAKVAIRDAKGAEAFTGVADEKGQAEAVLVQYRHAQKTPSEDRIGEKTVLTPHTVTVEKDGKKAEAAVTVDRKKSMELEP